MPHNLEFIVFTPASQTMTLLSRLGHQIITVVQLNICCDDKSQSQGYAKKQRWGKSDNLIENCL
jgi:hypothetical protein